MRYEDKVNYDTQCSFRINFKKVNLVVTLIVRGN